MKLKRRAGDLDRWSVQVQSRARLPLFNRAATTYTLHMARVSSVVPFILLLGLPPSCSDPSGDIPAGCQDLFDTGAFSCGTPSDSGPCDAAATQPQTRFEWRVIFDEDVPAAPADADVSELERKVNCSVAYLEAKGLRPVGAMPDRERFHVEATYSQVETLCRTSMVGRCAPEMVGGACEALDEMACAASPHCREYRGTRLDLQRGCRGPDEFAVCINPGHGCEDAPTTHTGPDFSCWAFGTGCYPERDDWPGAQGSCPDAEETWDWPEC